MNTKESNSIEIDLLYLLKKLWEKKILILFSTVLFGLLALLISVFILKPTFTSSTRIYVANQTSDLQAGTYLVNDYKEIITSDSVLLDVIAREGLSTTPKELTTDIDVEIPVNTRIITISVDSKSPEEAQQLANTLRIVASEKIKEVTKVEDVTTIEEAKLPETASSPNISRNVLLGALVGGFITVVMILLLELLDDRVRRPEDIEEVLGLVLIGTVPDTDKL